MGRLLEIKKKSLDLQVAVNVCKILNFEIQICTIDESDSDQCFRGGNINHMWALILSLMDVSILFIRYFEFPSLALSSCTEG